MIATYDVRLVVLSFLVILVALQVAFVAQRLSIEAALAESQRRLASLTDSLPGIVFSCGNDSCWSMTYLSEGCFTLTGYQSEELVGTKGVYNTITHPQDLPKVLQAIDIAITKQQPYVVEYRICTKSGQEKWLWEKGSGVFDSNGKVLGLEGIITDITERKCSEESLREGEQRYRELFESHPCPMWVYDVETLGFLAVNNAAIHHYGYTQNEFLSMTIKDIRPPKDVPALLEKVSQSASGLDKAGIWRHCKKDGTVIDVDITSHTLTFSGKRAEVVSANDVTLRQQTEEALRQAEAKYRSIFENAVEGIFQTTSDGHYISANPALARIYGYESPEDLIVNLINIDRQLYVDPNRRAEFIRLMEQHGAVSGFEAQIYRLDGSTVWISENARAVRDGSGVLLCYEGTVEDITEHKQIHDELDLRVEERTAELRKANYQLLCEIVERQRAEEALRESEERCRAVVEQTSEGIFLVDADTKCILEANAAFQNLLGYTLQEILGLTLYDIVALDRESIDHNVQRVMTQQHYFIGEAPHRRKDGSLVCAEVNVNAIFYGGKDVFCIIVRDITERKYAEEALRSSLATNRALINAIPDSMFRISSDGIFVNFKASKDNNLPVLKSEVLGKKLSEVLPIEVAQPMMDCVELALSTGVVQIFEYQLLVNNNMLDYEARLAAIAEDEVMAIIRDITQRKQAEADIRHALEKEKELSLLKSRFVNMASHEFRTPLTTILSSTELLQDYGSNWTQEKKVRHFQRIQIAVKHMTQLLNDVLLIGKAEAEKLECNLAPLDVIQFCSDLVDEMQITTHSHTIAFQRQSNCTKAYIDEKLLRQIISNLLSNAIKYSPSGGTVHFDLVCEQGEAIFRIQDRGIGIPLADQAKLFDSFHRASNVGTISGTGLGLAIVKKAVDLHDGKIAVESEVGVGTTFTVTLPLNKQV